MKIINEHSSFLMAVFTLMLILSPFPMVMIVLIMGAK